MGQREGALSCLVRNAIRRLAPHGVNARALHGMSRRLIGVEEDCARYSGNPLMTALPVRIAAQTVGGEADARDPVHRDAPRG